MLRDRGLRAQCSRSMPRVRGDFRYPLNAVLHLDILSPSSRLAHESNKTKYRRRIIGPVHGRKTRDSQGPIRSTRRRRVLSRKDLGPAYRYLDRWKNRDTAGSPPQNCCQVASDTVGCSSPIAPFEKGIY